jgi:hypothetical protein
MMLLVLWVLYPRIVSRPLFSSRALGLPNAFFPRPQSSPHRLSLARVGADMRHRLVYQSRMQLGGAFLFLCRFAALSSVCARAFGVVCGSSLTSVNEML